MTAGHIAGFYHALWMYRDANGYPAGTEADLAAASNGTTTHARKLPGPVEATAMQVTREQATFRGGQRVLGRRQLGVNDISPFDLTLAAYDPVWNAMIAANAVDTAIASQNVVSAPNLGNGDPPQGMLLLTVGFTTEDAVNKFLTYAYHNVQISQANMGAANQQGGENPNPLQYTVTPLPAERTFFGLPFVGTDLAVVEDNDYYVVYETAKPISVTTYKAANAATSFTLGYRPVSSDHAGARNVFTKNGAQGHTDVTGVNTTTGAVTINAATAGDIWVAVFETLFQAI